MKKYKKRLGSYLAPEPLLFCQLLKNDMTASFGIFQLLLKCKSEFFHKFAITGKFCKKETLAD